jgi:hypothetical protein
MRGLRGSAHKPHKPQGGAAHCRRSQRGRRQLGSLVGARGQNPLLPARDRWRNPSVDRWTGALDKLLW